MMKKRCSIVLSIVVISIFLSHGSFAQVCPPDPISDYLVSPDLEFYKEWCGDNLDTIKAKWLSDAQAVKDTLPPYQKELYEQTKSDLLIQAKLNSLISIKVYVAQDGVKFDTIRDYYVAKASESPPKLYLDDLVDVANNRNITERQEKLRLALAKIPPEYFPDDTHKARLEAYIKSGDLKGLIGTSIDSPGSVPQEGQSNISIQPIYIDPETYEVHDEATDGRKAWVIISTYSTAFAPPPLQPSP